MVRVKSFINETTRSILPSAEISIFEQFNKEQMKETIISLPKKYREVVYLYYYDSLKTDEISEALNIPVNTVKTRLRRAKQKLETILEEADLNER